MIPGMTVHGENTCEVAVGFAYPYYLSELGLERDAYGAEVARRCLVEDCKALGYSVIRLTGPKDWALANLPGGLEAGERGRNEFRPHYERLTRQRATEALKQS